MATKAAPTPTAIPRIWLGRGQVPLRHALRIGAGRSIASREALYHSLLWGVSIGLANGIMTPSRIGYMMFANLMFSFAIGYLSSVPWRWRLVPAGAPVALRAVASTVVACAAGYMLFVASMTLPHFLLYGAGPSPELMRTFLRLGAFGFVFAVVGFYIVLGQDEERRARLLERDARRLARLAEQARLVALRAQINPHFFFNALNTVAALIPTRPADAERAVELLAQALRPVLTREQPLLANVASEVEVARAYGEVERLRAGERLALTFDIEPAAAAREVPSLLLQPLVENSVRYGLDATTGTVAIAVRARIDGGALRLEVENRATGAAGPATGEAAHRPGHALHNVAQRLRALFGPDAGIRCEVGKGWARAEVRIPATAPAPEVLAAAERARRSAPPLLTAEA
ncbi:MAG: histidine kinase [Candidatus Sumerlaeia bacterium]|nr:histidine kinase [Candidatus Sumerlaeia bacterium]